MEWLPFVLFVIAGVILLVTSAVIVNYCEKEEAEEKENDNAI